MGSQYLKQYCVKFYIKLDSRNSNIRELYSLISVNIISEKEAKKEGRYDDK